MTYEEYVAKWLEYKKRQNVQDFYLRKMPIRVPWAQRDMTEEEKQTINKLLEETKKRIISNLETWILFIF